MNTMTPKSGRYLLVTNNLIFTKNQAAPGDGIRSLKTSGLFKAFNFELYVKPNLAIMGLGLVAFTGCLGYIAYMRHKYESMGYYSAVGGDGKEEFVKKKSKWD